MADPSETTQISRGERKSDDQLREAVEQLSAQVRGLQAELQAARSKPRGLPSRGIDAPGWDDGSPSPDQVFWVRRLDSPAARRPPIPRLFLEIAFLVAVAALAAVAELDAAVVIGVMAGAWMLVALVEWMIARETRLQHEALYRPAPVSFRATEESAWLQPPGDRAALEVVEGGDESGAKLPPPNDD